MCPKIRKEATEKPIVARPGGIAKGESALREVAQGLHSTVSPSVEVTSWIKLFVHEA